MMTDETTREQELAAENEDAAPGVASDEASNVGAEEAEDVERDDVVEEVEELSEALESLNERHLRLAAEFDNYRKRNERERQLLAARLQADLVAGLLDGIDDLQRVEETGPGTTVESLAEGVRLVEKKFISVLESAGLERVVAEGQPFDPEDMEALMTVPTDDPEQEGHVADVLQSGYRFRDVLIRPARVRVYQYEGRGEGSE